MRCFYLGIATDGKYSRLIMIDILHKKDCCGCCACEQRCPVGCISMQADNEGFFYPHVNKAECVNCGVCERVCPVINQDAPRYPIAVYAAKNPDAVVRKASSSGGIFTALAIKTIDSGGAVFGAKFSKDRMTVFHDFTDTVAGLRDFRGSKYLQSNIGNAYADAERLLKNGRKVLFSGTSCQIAGLLKFLGKDYSGLVTVDVVCHGVPSPKVWQRYLSEVTDSMPFTETCEKNVSEVSFRDKRNGWEDYGMSVTCKTGESLYEKMRDNRYMQGFLGDLYLRPSCYDCPSKCGKSHSNLTIADYWGVRDFHPEFADNIGVSLVFVNDEKGKILFDSVNVEKIESGYDCALRYNPSIISSVNMPYRREYFFKKFHKCGTDAIGVAFRKIRHDERRKEKRLMRAEKVNRVLNKIISRIRYNGE